MDRAMSLELWIRWLTFVPVVICSIFGLAITLAKWRQLRRPILTEDATLGMLRRQIEVGDFQSAAE